MTIPQSNDLDTIKKGLEILITDDIVLEYSNTLNKIRKKKSVYNMLEYITWNSYNEDFHFIYNSLKIKKLSYGQNESNIIEILSNNLKLERKKIIHISLLYGQKAVMEEKNETDNEIYNMITKEIEWFRNEYKIKTFNLLMRFKNI